MQNNTLNSPFDIPIQMLGTYPMKGKVLFKAVNAAISQNIKGLDSARDYGNESDLGKAIKYALDQNNLKREDLFITTKIGNRQQIEYHTKNISIFDDIQLSLKSLHVQYVDLLLMHWPYPNIYLNTWHKMENIPSELVKNIGVCNFKKRHLIQLLKECDKKPIVNQIEIHPLNIDWETIVFCQENNIKIQAYCPLGLMDKQLIQSNILNLLSQKYNKTIAQIILRWHYQHKFLTVPKSSSSKRIQENQNIFDFELSKEEVQEIDKMNVHNKFYTESFYCPGY